MAAFKGRDLLRVPAEQVIEGCLASRRGIDECAARHSDLGFLHPCLGRQFVGERLACGRVALAADLDLVGRFAGVVRPARNGSHGRSTRRWSAFTWANCPASVPREQKEDGAPDWVRTSDPCLRRAVLYPAELRARVRDLIRSA